MAEEALGRASPAKNQFESKEYFAGEAKGYG
jgi:hypothetical protein